MLTPFQVLRYLFQTQISLYCCFVCISHAFNQEQDFCLSNWVDYNETCYTLFNDKRSWYDANQHCISLGGNLPIIRDGSTNEFVRDLMNRYNVWIGLMDNDNSNVKNFTWVDGSLVTYSSWDKGEPNSFTISEDCVEMYQNGLWNDVNCHVLKRYICSISKGSPKSSIAMVSSTSVPVCYQSEWVLYEGNCYLFGDDELSWSDAGAKCSSQGGNLTSVLSARENNFLLHQLSKRKYFDIVWIGYKSPPQYHYPWLNSRNFGNWPGSDKKKGDCIVMTHTIEFWYKISCSHQQKYICKKANTYVDSTTTGTPTTEILTTGMPTAGIPTKGIPTTGIPTNGILTTGIPTTGIPLDHTKDQSSNTAACSLNSSSLESEPRAGQTPLCRSDIALIVILTLIFVGGVAVAVTFLIKRRLRRSPRETLTNEDGFSDVLYTIKDHDET